MCLMVNSTHCDPVPNRKRDDGRNKTDDGNASASGVTGICTGLLRRGSDASARSITGCLVPPEAQLMYFVAEAMTRGQVTMTTSPVLFCGQYD